MINKIDKGKLRDIEKSYSHLEEALRILKDVSLGISNEVDARYFHIVLTEMEKLEAIFDRFFPSLPPEKMKPPYPVLEGDSMTVKNMNKIVEYIYKELGGNIIILTRKPLDFDQKACIQWFATQQTSVDINGHVIYKAEEPIFQKTINLVELEFSNDLDLYAYVYEYVKEWKKWRTRANP